MLPLDFCEHGVVVGTSELPFEGSGDPLIMVLEVEQPGLNLDEVGKVVGGEHLALHYGEVDLDLVEPGSMHRKMDEHQVGPSSLQPVDGGPSAGATAVVHDPKHSLGGGV